MRAIAIAFALLFAATFARAGDLPSAAPAEVGLSAERLNRITQMLRADAEKGTIPGAVIMVARHGKVALFEAVGVSDPGTKTPMARDTLFRIYSMTKPITTVSAMMLFEEGRLQLSDPVAKYIAPFGGVKVGVEKPAGDGAKPTLELVAARRPMSLQDLMRHTSGLTYGFFGDMLVKKQYVESGQLTGDYTNAEFVERLAKLPLAFQPGTTWDYSYSTDVLGRVVEVVEGKPLLQVMKQRLFEPLGMKDSSFYVTDKAQQPRIAEPFPNDRNIGAGVDINDPREERKWESGGGGLMSTAMDYARFAQMLLNGGTLDGKRYLSPKTVAYMASDHTAGVITPGPYYLPGPGYGFGLGFAVRRENGVAPYAGTAGDYFWGGAGGTYFWVDPKEDMFVVFMMQSPKQRVYYRGVVRDMVYAAVEK
ncbi:MAG TPA: serine hydrolase domain-containing protein [Reyranella sp.]|jgi:CubicO group peptidase (beta-lactamase class C family)|nr:serine hydrolase domain-containing protein [Reyranella sp.]